MAFSIRKRKLNILFTILCLAALVSTMTTATAQTVTGADSNAFNPDFYIYSSPVYLTIPQGTSQNATISAASLDGFSGTIALSLNVPSGLSTTLFLDQLSLKSGGSNSTKLKVEVPQETATGSYSIKVTGTSGENSRYAYVIVKVVKPDFTMYASPSYLSIVVGNSQNTTLKLSPQYGWSGTVSLSALLPNGIELLGLPSSVAVSSTESTSLALKITVPPTTAAKSYIIPFNAVSGSLSHQYNVTVSALSPDFSVTASPSYLTIPVGSVATSKISVYSLSRYNGTISLSTSTPEGWSTPTLLVNPLKINSTTNNATTLTVTVPSTAKAGTFIIKVTGTDGTLSHYVNVTIRTIIPDFYISASPSYIYVPVGASASTTIRVSSLSYFNGTVTFSTNTPTSVVPTLQDSSRSVNMNTNTTVLTVTVPSSAAVGNQIVNITGVSGSLRHSVNLTVCVIAPDFSVSASPSYLTIPVGTSANTNIRVYPSGRFNGTVTFTVTSPAGLTATPTSNTLTINMTTSNSTSMPITVASDTAPGTYRLKITATSGTLTHSYNVTVVVTKPDFSIIASPSTISNPAGTSSGATVIVRSLSAFNGTVNLSATAPAGWTTPTLLSSTLTLKVATSTTPTNTTAIVISIPSTATTGDYTITVIGVSGSLTHSVNITVKVTA